MTGTILKCSCGKEGDAIFDCKLCYPIPPQQNSWQLCPACNANYPLEGTLPCRICNSKGIISTITGKPPIE